MEPPEPLLDFWGKLADSLAYDFSDTLPLIPTYFLLILAALFPIYTGAHASLTRPPSAAKPKRRRKKRGDAENEEVDDPDEKTQKIEGLTPMDAITFPLTAGIVLSSLYFLIKWLQDPAMLNKILNWYLAVLGVFFLSGFLNDSCNVLRSVAFPSLFSRGTVIAKVDPRTQMVIALTNSSIPKNLDESDDEIAIGENLTLDPTGLSAVHPPLAVKLRNVRSFLYTKATAKLYIHPLLVVKTGLDILSLLTPFPALAILLYFNIFAKPWWITNLLGFSFSYSALQRMSPTTFWTGTLLLSSLFFYDIYFVFYTPMMVSVATQLDVPIKLLIPRPKVAGEEKTGPALAMLGLGDIVIPGMMMALALRFDLYLFYLKKQKSANPDSVDTSSQTKANKPKLVKPIYTRASGGWGERFWTSFDSRNPPDILAGKIFPKPYFYTSLVGYFLAMVVTEIVLHTANHAQPALLYLVPGVLGALWGTAWWKGEVKEMWEYSEMEEEQEKERKKKEEEKADTGEEEKAEQEDEGKKDWKSWFGFGAKSDRKPHKPENEAEHTSSTNILDDEPSSEPPQKKVKLSSKFSNSKRKPKKEKAVPLAKASKLLSTDLSDHLFYFSVTLPSPSHKEKTPLLGKSPKSDSTSNTSDVTSSGTSLQPPSPTDSASTEHTTSSASAEEEEPSLEQQLKEAAEGSIRGSDVSPSLSSDEDEVERDELWESSFADLKDIKDDEEEISRELNTGADKGQGEKH